MSKNLLVVEAIHTQVVDPSSRMKREVNKAIRARPSGYVFSQKYKQGLWDGWISLYKRGKFPTGLLHHVTTHLLNKGVKFKVKDKRGYKFDASNIPVMLGDYILRDYQIEAVRQLMRRQNGIAHMATNAGKTLVFSTMISMLEEARSVVIVHSRDLLYQVSDVVADLTGFTVGRIGDGLCETDEQVLVISIDTLRTKFKRISSACKDVSMMIVDECHHSSASGTFKLLSKFPPNRVHRRYGVSGTPLHYNVLDDLHVIGLLGPIVTTVTNLELIEQGYSIMPMIHMHPINVKPDNDLEYREAYDQLIVDNDSRNVQILRLIEDLYETGPVLIMVDRIRHGKKLMNLIYETGLSWMNVQFATGEMDSEERQYLLDQMRSGRRIAVISTVFREGIDVPNLCGLIIACGGSGGSHIKLLQMIGRVIRHKEGFQTVQVHDFIDYGSKYLRKHSNERMQLYLKEGFQVRAARTRV